MSLLSRSRWRSPVVLVAAATVALLVAGGAAPAALAAGDSLALDKSTYTPGQNVVATYSTTRVTSTNWVGIYNSRDTPGTGPSSLVWAYAPNSSGTVTLSTSSLSPGSYRAHFLYNNGYTAIAQSVFFTIVTANTVSTPTSAVCVGQVGYPQGQPVRASYATADPSSTNWVGIYPDNGQQPGPGSLAWSYATGSSGSVSLPTTGLAQGNYQAYLLANDGYTPLARAAKFAVTAPGGTSSPNLIVNGDAECGNPSASGYDNMTIPGWQQTGLGTPVSYDAGNGFPGPSTAGPANRGGAFFSGGPVGDSTLVQTADVSAAATAIDGGGVTYNLSGWLGGYAGEISTATVKLTFRNASGASLGSGQIGPVTAADRGNATKLLQRTATGWVPAATRTIVITLLLTGDPARNASNSYNDSYADNLSLTVSTPLTAPAVGPPAAASTPQYDHVFFVMLENRSYDQVIGNSAAPYLTQFANANVRLGNSYGAVHPSDPNYMAVAGGSTFGHVDNPMPGSIGELTGKHLGDLVEAKGKSWRGYIEDMGTPCNLKNNGNFDPDNMPFLFFRSLAGNAARCQDRIKPITQLWTDLQSTSTTPNFVWFEPNTCNTMHNCSTQTGDTWFQNNLSKILNSPAWTQQRSLLVITFDEDNSVSNQKIPTIIAGSQNTTKVGYLSNTRCTHYSLSRVMENALGLPHLTQNDQFANPLNDIWQ